MPTIKIFKYIDKLDCFLVNPDYKILADKLGLTEWNEVVWIGRYFSLDNDYGEHWFDNWEERDKIADQAKELGIEYNDLLVINSDRFKNDRDGPCHTAEDRKRFWTDVLRSLELSIDMIIDEAIKFNAQREIDDDDFVANLDDKINSVKTAYL